MKDKVYMEVHETVSPYAKMMEALKEYINEMFGVDFPVLFVDELPEEGQEDHLYVVKSDGTARIWKDGWVELDEVIASISVNGEEQEIVNRSVDISVPTKVSELENDSKYVDEDDLDAVDREAQEAQESADNAQKSADKAQETADRALEDIPTKVSQLENDSDYATKDETIGGIQVNGVDQEAIERIVNIFVPTKTSELENDSDFTTTEAMKKEIAAQIAEIVAGAPESLDTLKEIADWIEGHAKDAAEMNSQIKQNAEDIEDLQDLIGELPASASSVVEYIEAVAGEVPTKVSELENDANYVDQEALDAVEKQADEALEKAKAVEDAAITGINVNGTPAEITDHIADIEVSGGGGYSITYDEPEEALVFAAGAGITYDEPTETLIF